MKKLTLAVLALCLASGGVWAQSAAKPKADTKKAAKAEPKSKVDARSKAEQTAAGIEAAEAALTPDELAIAERVFVGRVPCELNNFVTLAADPQMPGYFDVTVASVKNQKFHMFPVISATGAIRLEDKRNGAVWLQLGNKSMLMSQKLGIRLADACVTPQQAVVQAAMDKAPPVNLLEARPRVLPASAAGTVVTTTTTTTTTYVATPVAATATAAASAPLLPVSAVVATTTTTTTVAPITPAGVRPASPASAPAAPGSAATGGH